MKRLSFVPAALLFDNQRVEDALKSVPTVGMGRDGRAGAVP